MKRLEHSGQVRFAGYFCLVLVLVVVVEAPAVVVLLLLVAAALPLPLPLPLPLCSRGPAREASRADDDDAAGPGWCAGTPRWLKDVEDAGLMCSRSNRLRDRDGGVRSELSARESLGTWAWAVESGGDGSATLPTRELDWAA